MTYEPCPSLITKVVSVVDIGKEDMNIVELVIQVLGPSCAVCMMCILCHVEILKLVENHSLKLGVCRSSILKRVIKLNCHGLWFIFSLVFSTSSRFMVIGSNFNICTMISFNQPSVSYFGESHLMHVQCGNMIKKTSRLFKLSFHIHNKVLNELGYQHHIWNLEIRKPLCLHHVVIDGLCPVHDHTILNTVHHHRWTSLGSHHTRHDDLGHHHS